MSIPASDLTLAEQQEYQQPGRVTIDVSTGYPIGLTPGWMQRHQEELPAGWRHVPPAWYVRQVTSWFRGLLAAEEIFTDVKLTLTCSIAFVLAARAVIREPGDEVIVIDQSYDSWPRLLEEAGAQVIYAPRAPDGTPDPAAVAAACTPLTRAVVIVSPDNPLGVITRADVLASLAGLCEARGITLITDHCLAGLNPYRTPIPVLPRLAPPGLSWIALGDTGKLAHLDHTKFGALAYPPQLAERIEAAASPHFFAYEQYALALLGTVLSDDRFQAHRLELSARISVHHRYLQEKLAPVRLDVGPVGGGCFALIDTSRLRIADGDAFAGLLRAEYGTRVIPVGLFPPKRPDPRIRVALSRPFPVIEQLAGVLRDAAVQAR